MFRLSSTPSAGFTTSRNAARSQPRLQAQVDVGRMSSRLEDFQVQGAMCLGAALAQYGEVGKYSKHRCGRVDTASATTVAEGVTCGA